MATTKAFFSGRSQAIRIPKECRYPDNEELCIRKYDDVLIVVPTSKLKETYLSALNSFTDDYMSEGRAAFVSSERESL